MEFPPILKPSYDSSFPKTAKVSYNIRSEVVVTDTPDPFAPKNENKVDQPNKDRVDGDDALQDFFRTLPGNFRWPKPDPAAVAAAEQAIQKVASGPAPGDANDLLSTENSLENDEEPESVCASCGGLLPTVARFCVWCGIPTKNAGGDVAAQDARQRHVHHHFHHIMPAQGATAQPERPAPPSAVRQPTAPGGRAETAARQVIQNWVQACNIRHIDDLLELYSPDATVIRSNVPPVRSLPAIRAFLVSLLEAGLGDVEMESLRFELLGDIALDIGRCKMLVPVAMGKRREERGKYLIVMTRQAGVEWKIIADSWSSDSPVNVPITEPGAKRPGDPPRQTPQAPKLR